MPTLVNDVYELELGKPLVPAKRRAHQLRLMKYWRASVDVTREYLTTPTGDERTVLQRFKCERDEDWQERLAITPLRNIIQSFVRRYNSAVFRQDPDRQPSDTNERLQANADGRGRSLNRLMSHALYEAQVAGAHALALSGINEMDADIDGAELTQAQLEAAGEVNVLVGVRGEDILAAQYQDEQLVTVLLLFEDAEGLFARQYDAISTRDIRLRKAGGDNDHQLVVDRIGAQIPHGMDGIPVAIVRSAVDQSQVSGWAEYQRDIHNTESLLRVELRDHTFTRFVMSGIRGASSTEEEELGEAPARPDIQWGSRRIFTFDDENVSVERLGSDTSQADSLRKSLSDDKEELYRAAGLQANYRIDGQPESGISRLVQMDSFTLQAEFLADEVEQADNHLVRLIHEAEGVSAFVPAVYSRDFLDADFDAEMSRIKELLPLVDDAYGEESAAVKQQLISKILRRNFEIENLPSEV